MRIAQVSTLSAPVTEDSSGSIESWLWLLTRELVHFGHDVTVFATADSQLPTGAKLVATQPGAYGVNGALDDWQLSEWLNIGQAVERSAEFDVLHAHAYLWSLPLSRVSRAPLVHTTHIVPDDNIAKLLTLYPEAHVTAISHQQWKSYPQFTLDSVIHHGVDITKFPFQAESGDYVCYLGRFVSGKGPRQAIAIAQELGVRLLMAGPRSAYFREQVAPLIDGKSVEYVGFVKGAERAQFLGGARALLYPIQYPESFGLVLLESMLCGTPVAAMRLGAVPEILDEGVTGYSADTIEDLPEAVTKCFGLNRSNVRRWAEGRFSVQLMTKRYEQFYERVLGSAKKV